MTKFKVTCLVSKIDDQGIEIIEDSDIWVCDETDYQTLATECDGDPTRFAISTIANLVDHSRHPSRVHEKLT